eukprot:4028153-Amphidinium_carterae.2
MPTYVSNLTRRNGLLRLLNRMLSDFGSFEAAVAALEVRPQGRGSLSLESKTLRPPKEDRETKQDAMRQHLEASLLRTARTGQAVLAHAWPSWLGECPPIAQAQRDLLEGRISSRKTQRSKDSRKAWQTYVREAW